MSTRPTDPLLLAGRVLTLIMQGLLGLAGIAVTLVLPIVIFFREKIDAELLKEFGTSAEALPLFPLIALLLCCLVALYLAFRFFGNLRRIIETVEEGDPFVAENADRLTAMAWLLTGAYAALGAAAIAAIPVLEWATSVGDKEGKIAFGVDLTAILTIVILFILARVFRKGTEMREELEGTV